VRIVAQDGRPERASILRRQSRIGKLAGADDARAANGAFDEPEVSGDEKGARRSRDETPEMRIRTPRIRSSPPGDLDHARVADDVGQDDVDAGIREPVPAPDPGPQEHVAVLGE
jgi:hypothetical protein